jgi:hypothetical protein
MTTETQETQEEITAPVIETAETKAPHISFTSQEKFNDRLERHYRSSLKKEFGVEDPAELKKVLGEIEKYRAEDETRRLASLSEKEQLEEKYRAAEERAQALQSERDQIRFESHVNSACAGLRITNIDYAMYQVAKATEALPEGKQLDVVEFLSGLASQDSSKAALGVSQVVSSPATNTPATNGQPTSGFTIPTKGVMDMTNAEFQAHLATRGISG